MIITISVALELPAATILELLGDAPPGPVLSHPVDGGSTVGSVDFEKIETWSESERAHGEGLPEADPLDDLAVLVDGLTLLEVERGIGVHGGSLDEGLELITWMGRCSLDTSDALDWLLSQDGVTETASNVRELLVISPLDFPLVTLVVIVMARGGSIFKSLLEVDLLGLGEPGAGGLSPSVIEIKVLVVQMLVDVFTVSGLVVLSGDVALLLEVFRADLSDMHINEVGVVTVDLHHLVGVLAVDVDVVVGADVLVGQDHLRLAELVSWGIHVSNLQVASLLLLIDLEEEVLLGDDLVIGALSELLSGDLVFEFNETNFLLDNLIDSFANLLEVIRASSLTKWLVSTWRGGVLFQGVEVSCLGGILLSSLLHGVRRVVPKCHNRLSAGGFSSCGSGALCGNFTGVCTLAVVEATFGTSQQHLKHLVLSTDHI